MIGTHAPKLFNARMRQEAIRARPLSVPDGVVCSRNVVMRRELWALPSNAADMAVERQAAEEAPSHWESSIPDIEDPRIKQVLLPGDGWRSGDYVAVSPMPSCGLMHELWTRLYARKLPRYTWTVQPMAVALPNHGEMLMKQTGRINLLRRGIAEIRKGKWTGDFVCIRARVEHANIAGGMLAVGWPALTAIGGFAHVLERETGEPLEFAFGLRNTDWNAVVPKFSVNRKIGQQVKVAPGYSTEEITGNLEIVLLLRYSDGGYDSALAAAARRMTRFSGGAMFDMRVTTHRDSRPINAAYLIDATADVERLIRNHEAADALDAALAIYGLDGSWQENGEWFQPRSGYTLNMSGYALLENPHGKQYARNGSPHAWSEPLFTLVTQGAMSDSAWWGRSINNGYWQWTCVN